MFAYLAEITVPQPNMPTVTADVSFNQATILLLLDFFIVALLLVVLVYLLRAILHSTRFLPNALQKTVLLVTVPKESAEAAEQQQSLEHVRHQISMAESWFATLGGLRAQRGLRAWLWGRSDIFSLEIVSFHGLISFYVAVPHYLRDFMEQQVLAQYPEANITEVEDYNIFAPNSVVVNGYLKMTRSYIFPLKTFQNLNTDPLNALTNSLSRVSQEDGVAIQIIARSAHKRWHRRGMKVASHMQRGKTLNEALAQTTLISTGKMLNFFNVKSPEQIQREKSMMPRTLSPMEQELVKGLEQKTSKAGLDCNIRIIVSASSKAAAQAYFNNVVDSFSQYNYYQYGNSLKAVHESSNRSVNDFIYRTFRDDQKMILNTEELASIFHLPTPYLETPNIRWLLAKKLTPPPNLPQDGILLGENNYRGVKTNVYLKTDDRRRHSYIIGMTGTGKSVLMANMAIQDIRNGKGVCVVDPHGSLVESILECIPKERMDEVIYFNPADVERPIGLNMLEAETLEQQDFVIQEMIAIFYKLVTDPAMIGPMFEHNMRNAMLTLMADRESPGTIAEIPRMFTDKDFQKYKVSKVTDPMVRSFWEQEMAKTSDFHKSEMLGYLISKVGRFIENGMVRNIIGQPQSGLNFRDVMDKQKILLVNLSKGKVGEVNSNLLGLIIVAKLQMAALSRTDIPENQRQDFYLYLDEFQNFITDSIAIILAEARKYKLNLILAHQYLGQLTEGTGPEGKNYGSKIRDAIFGNVGTLVSFRIGVEDSEIIAKQMAPVVDEYDLMNIERYNAYVRLLVDNQPQRTFNIHTFPPIIGHPEVINEIIEISRWKYGADRQKVESEIISRSKLGLSNATDIKPPLERTL